MKPAPFDYQAPDTLREAIDLLASNPEAFVIAGGQSLMPVLAFRLATPSLLVDLRRLPGLGNIAVGDDGLSLGALVSWRDIEDDQRLVSAHPLLRQSLAPVLRCRNKLGSSDRSSGVTGCRQKFASLQICSIKPTRPPRFGCSIPCRSWHGGCICAR